MQASYLRRALRRSNSKALAKQNEVDGENWHPQAHRNAHYVGIEVYKSRLLLTYIKGSLFGPLAVPPLHLEENRPIDSTSSKPGVKKWLVKALSRDLNLWHLNSLLPKSKSSGRINCPAGGTTYQECLSCVHRGEAV